MTKQEYTPGFSELYRLARRIDANPVVSFIAAVIWLVRGDKFEKEENDRS